MDNKRVHPRVNTALRAKLSLNSGEVLTTGQIRNISLGGVFIETATLLAFGTDLDLEFALPGKGSPVIRCKGYVVWNTKTDPKRGGGLSGMGLRLTNIEVQEMRSLAAFIDGQLEG
jgi:uncharacterized protein (TIGR02266 family)